MYNFFVDLLIWTFFIFGFIKFLEEFFYDIIYYGFLPFTYIVRFFKKVVDKIKW